MDFAKDNSGNHIQAVDGSPWSRYLCIYCEGDAKLAKGRKKKPYFYHLRGRHPEKCEEYFTSHYKPGILTGGSASKKSTYRSLPNYKLDLELNSKNFPDLWSLKLFLPQNPDASGDSLIIDTGRGTKNIILEELKISGLYLPIHPRDREYIIIPRPNYASYFNFKDNIKGLEDNLNFFNSNKYKNKRYSSSYNLHWDNKYFVIWHASFQIPSFLNFQVSEHQIDGWKCGLLELPENEDLQIKEWIENNSNYKLEKEKIRIEILSQGIIQYNGNTHAILDEKDCLLSIKRNSKLLDDEVKIQINDILTSYYFDESDIIYVNLQLEPSDIAIVKYETESYYFTHEENLTEIEKIDSLCNFIFNYNNENKRISLFDKNFTTYFKYLENKSATIEKIEYLPIVDFIIQINNTKVIKEKKLEKINFTPTMKEIDQEIIDKINSISFKKLNNYFLKFGNLITYKKEDDVVVQKFPKRINRKLLFKYLILSNDEINLIKVKNCWNNDERITDIITKISPNLHLRKLYNSILVK